MASDDAQLLQLLEEAGLGNTGLTEEDLRNELASYGIELPPPEGADYFQPIRTFFGGAGNVGGQLAGLAAPEAYEAASENVASMLGVTPDSPWYEHVEAAPGAGDVLAELVPESVSESLVGKALGPIGRMAGNILGDPTTYVGGFLAKGAGKIAATVPLADDAIRAAQIASKERQMGVAAGHLTAAAAKMAEAVDAERIAQIVMREGSPLQRNAFILSEGLSRGGDLAMGTGAALAYGPEVVKATYESAKAIPEAESFGEGAAQAVNTALMGGLSALMGKGLIDAGEAMATLRASSTGKALDAVRGAVDEGQQALGGIVSELPTTRRLRELGWADDQISQMNPDDASRIMADDLTPDTLGRQADTLPPENVEVAGPPTDTLPPEGPDPRTMPPRAGVDTLAEPPERRFAHGGEPLFDQAGNVVARRMPDGAVVPEGRVSDMPPRRTMESAPDAGGTLPPVRDTGTLPPEPVRDTGTLPPSEPTIAPVQAESAVSPLPTDLVPYAEFVEGGDLAGALVKQGATLDDFRALGHQERMEVLAGKRTVEAPVSPVEPVRATEPVPVEPEPVLVAPEPTKAPPAEPTAQPADSTPVVSKETTQDITPLAPDAERVRLEGVAAEAVTKHADGLTENTTFGGVVRNIIAGSEKRKTGPDSVRAGELLTVLDDVAARADLAKALDGVEARNVMPTVKGFLDKRLTKGGEGVGDVLPTRGATGNKGDVEKAGPAKGTKADQMKGATDTKLSAADKEPYNVTKGILKAQGLDIRQFVDEISDDFEVQIGRQPTKWAKNKELFKEFVELREGGMSQVDAINELAVRHKARFSGAHARQSIRNLINAHKKGVLEQAEAQFKEKLAENLDESPTASKPSAVDVAGLATAHKQLASQFPVRADGVPVADFVTAMKTNPKAVLGHLRDYFKFAWRRSQVKGQGRMLKDARLKQFALDVGVTVPAKESVADLIHKIAEKLDLVPGDSLKARKAYWNNFRKELEGTVRTKAAVGGKFTVEGWKGKEGKWEGEQGTKIEVIIPGKTEAGAPFEATVREIKSPAQAKIDIANLLSENPNLDVVLLPDEVKGLGPVMDDLPLVLDEVWLGEHPDSPLVRYKVDKTDVQPFEARELADPYNPSSGEGDLIHSVEYQDAISSDEVFEGLTNQLANLGIKGTLTRGADGAVSTRLGSGFFHNVDRLNGVTTADGSGVVMRTGLMPWVPMVTDAQQALMAPVLGHGLLAESAVGRKMYYSLHPEGWQMKMEAFSPGELDKTGKLYDLMRFLGFSNESGTGRSVYFSELGHDHNWARIIQEKQLPPGISLQDWIDDHATLFARAIDADMRLTDIGAGGPDLRTNQTMYMKLDGAAPSRAVLRNAEDGAYMLVFNDHGAVRPNEISRLGTAWEGLTERQMIAMKKVEGEADSVIPLRDAARRTIHYAEDDILGLRLDEDGNLILANHDRRATDEFVSKMAGLTAKPAKALADITDDMVKSINDALGLAGSDDLFDVKYRGQTASPHLAGLYHEGADGARIYTNLVEAVASGGNYEKSIEDALYALIHEVTHNKGKGHGKIFQSLEDYVTTLVTAQGKFDDYVKMLKEALPEHQFNKIRDDLVPEYTAMRGKYGRPSWRSQALGELPARTAADGTPTGKGGLARGAEDLAGDLDAGVQRGEAVPGSGGFKASKLRSSPTARRVDAKGHAQAQGAGYSGGRSDGSKTGGYEATRARVEEFIGRDKKLDAESAKRLLDDFVEVNKMRGAPVKEIHDVAWDMALRVINHMKDDDIDDFLKGRKPGGKQDSAFNLMVNADLSKRQQARMHLWGEFTKGHRKRDKIRHWAEVDDEVKELLGLDTPEGWAMAMRKRGGGLTDTENLLLRQIHNDLADRVFTSENRFHEAMAKGDKPQATAAWDELEIARKGYYLAANKMADSLTTAGRALRVAAKTIRKADPQLAFEQDLMAGLRERVKSKYRDPAEADRVSRKLFGEFMAAKGKVELGDPDAWGDFYNAYRVMMRSKLWPDKIIEFYKAGLLGWSSRVANLTSNTLFRGVRYIEDAVAGAFDSVGSKLEGREREVFMGEAGVSALAMRRAFAEGFQPWAKSNIDAFRLKPDDAAQAMKVGGIMEDLLQHPGAIEGKLGEFIRFNFKGLTADDVYAKHVSRTDYMYRQIYRRLRKGELKLGAGETYVQATERMVSDFRDNWKNGLNGLPFDKPKFDYFEKIAKAAEVVAREETFQKQLPGTMRGLQAGLRDHPWGQIFIPFLRTPWNIAGETLKRTPLGFFDAASKWKTLSKAERMQALSKPATGTVMGMGIMAMAMNGDITGGGPLDPEDQEALRASGWQPYSIKVGNQWVSYQRFEPIAAIFGIAADASDGIRNGDFDQWNTGAMRVLQSSAENITNKTFLAGLDGVTSAISHPNLFLGRFQKQMQGSMIPNSLGFVPVAHLARAIDPVFRAADPLTMEVWTRKIPWLSKTVDPQYGPTGEERKRGGTAIERMVSPFARWDMRDGPEAAGAEEIVRLSAAPAAPKRFMYSKGGTKVMLTPEERKALALSMRAATKVIGQRVVKDPNYLKLPDDEDDPRYRYGGKTKQDVIKKIYRKYRAATMKKLKPEFEKRAVQEFKSQQADIKATQEGFLR